MLPYSGGGDGGGRGKKEVGYNLMTSAGREKAAGGEVRKTKLVYLRRVRGGYQGRRKGGGYDRCDDVNKGREGERETEDAGGKKREDTKLWLDGRGQD